MIRGQLVKGHLGMISEFQFMISIGRTMYDVICLQY